MQSKQFYHTQIETLRQQIARLEGTGQRPDAPAIPSGSAALDRILPEGGFRPGTVVEWLSAAQGTGAVTLALLAAREACRAGGTLVVVDRTQEFYPPAAARLGIDLARLIVVHVHRPADHTWALDQALRSSAVAATLAWPDAQGGKLAGQTFRRLQLAAEEGGGLGLLVRPETARQQPSWADVRVWVEPVHRRPLAPRAEIRLAERDDYDFSAGPKRRLRLVLLRCRGGTDGQSVEVEVDDETHSVLVAPRLAPAKARSG
jgi:protein ImuA